MTALCLVPRSIHKGGGDARFVVERSGGYRFGVCASDGAAPLSMNTILPPVTLQRRYPGMNSP